MTPSVALPQPIEVLAGATDNVRVDAMGLYLDGGKCPTK
jgi:hypothetical protein